MLYQIPLEWAAIELALEESAGELTPDLEKRLQDLLQGGPEKLENAMKVCKSLEAQATAAKTEAQRLQDRAKSFDNQVERLRTLMLPALQALGGKVKTPLFSFFTQTRKNVLFTLKPGFEIFELPSKFWRAADPELNKVELKKAEAAGETLPDCLAIVKTETVSMTVR